MKGDRSEALELERKKPFVGARNRRRPLLATLGDPNGVGPRIVARALARPMVAKLGLVAVGDPAVFREALVAEGVELPLVQWKPSSPVVPGAVHLWTPEGLEPGTIEPGIVTRWAGAQSLRCVDAATELCLEGTARGMVTAPLAKEAVSLVLPGFSGHTGHIARLCGVEAHCLCLVHKHLWAAFVTTHIALREVSAVVTTEGIVATTLLLDEALRRSGIQVPRIGIAGLNPHAGEHGLFGDEESRVVEPAIAILRDKGLDVTGPWPADVVFPMLNAGRIDGVTSLYHDQGHPVMKTLAFDFRKGLVRGVNVTLGLPIVRTSPDHGTGFDIAWRRSADDGSLLDAIRLADRMSRP
jgi:4-hydroxythreonine-4-phosphate dehydrogenase